MFGYAYYRMDYLTLYEELDVYTLGEMFKAQMDMEEREQDRQLQVLAWQTSLLMNATGNYKKPVKPDTLYTPMIETKQAQNTKQKKDDFKQKQEELMKTFGITMEQTLNEGGSRG